MFLTKVEMRNNVSIFETNIIVFLFYKYNYWYMSGMSKINIISKIIDYGHRIASLDIGRGESVFRHGNCGPM